MLSIEIYQNLNNKISRNERDKKLADLREKYVMDQKAFVRTGLLEGIEHGKLQESYNKAIEIAKKMLEKEIVIE